MPGAAPPASPSRSRAHDIARTHGWNATSFQTLGRGFSYLFHEDGYVAYVDTGSAWVAAGAPVCSDDALASAVDAFVAAARAAGRRSCFFGVEARLLDAATAALDRVPIGEQPVWSPLEWLDSLKEHPSLREQLRRARAKGVVIRQLSRKEPAAIAEQLPRLLGRWLSTRAMPPLGFLVAVPHAFESVDGERFVALRDELVVGVACVIPVPGRNGWFLEHLLRDPDAPNGTVELLVDAVMRWAAERGSSWLTLGLAPLAGDVAPPLRLAQQRLRWLYDFEGLRRFKAKLHPRDWVPIYLAFPRSRSAALAMFDALNAFATGGMLSFGGRFILRGHPAVIGTLGALLVPWTALLAGAPAEDWFAGHAAVKWAWVAFDLALLAGIAQLLRRPSWRLATLLAAAASLDALLTPLEAAFWNLPYLESFAALVLVLLACLAPLLAALAFGGASRRLARQGL
jgi:phosphatidylglycerol lysyltransferase